MSIQRINPAELYDGEATGLSQATVETASGLVFVSGQVAWNQAYETTDTTVDGQARQALDNLRIALTAAGSSVDQVLHVRAYVRGELSDHMPTLAPLLAAFFGGHRPAVTGIGVASLAAPGLLVEIEAIARVG